MHATDFGRTLAANLQTLQDQICDVLGGLDGGTFGDDRWTREQGGGGRSRVLEDGPLIEKSGVLFSGIKGRPLPDVVRRENPELPAEAVYFATGVSLIIHPRNPYVPTVHFNVRYFEVGDIFWFGGGMDLTPYYAFREDCIHFHRTLKAACDRVHPAYYARFKPACDRYFYLRHRDEPRGVGGIFFNYLKDDRARSGEFLLELGRAFLAAYVPIVERRRKMAFGERERAFQAYRRGRYVEFNLLYDQGTLFGLQSGGRTESILVSLPPQVAWRYDWQPAPDGPEAALTRDFLPPRDWAAER